MIEKELQALQITEETFRKALDELTRALSDKNYSHTLKSWESFYARMFKGKSREKKKALLYVIVLLVKATVDSFFKALMNYDVETFKKAEREFGAHDFYLALLHVMLAGGMVYLHNTVELTNILLSYLEKYEESLNTQKKEQTISEDSGIEEIALQIMSLGAIFGLLFITEEPAESKLKIDTILFQ